MWLTLIVLPDGTEIFSGPGSGPKVQNATIKLMVNDGEELNFGSCCASRFECTLLNPGGELSIAAGDEITVYRVKTASPAMVSDDITTSIDDNGDFHVYYSEAEVIPTVDAAGNLTWPGLDVTLSDGNLLFSEVGSSRTLVGKFTMEEPSRPSANRYHITAYDRVSWLDKDLTNWLLALEGWPYTVNQFAGMVAHECGIGIVTEALLNGSYAVQRFAGNGITGRKIMQWIGEISGTFCRVNPDGGIVFERYCSTSTIIGPAGIFSMKLADYQTASIDRVQIKLSQDDIGTIYPDTEGVTYAITGNYLLTTSDPSALDTVAQNIYNAVAGVSYTPGTVVTAHNPDIQAGDIITVRDRNGKTAQMYVMSKTVRGQRDTLECTGSISRESSTATHEESFKAVNAQMLEIRKDISGLLVRATETVTRIEDNQTYTNQKITDVAIAANSLASTVQNVQESVEGVASQITAIQQNADAISLKVQSIVDDGVDKVSTEFGLTVDGSAIVIARSGAETENCMDETGVYVVRSDGTVVMQAAKDGVISQNLNVRGYLDVFGMLRQQAWTDEQGRPCVATLWTGG